MRINLCILPTEKCGLNCRFCSYKARKKTTKLDELNPNSIEAQFSLKNLISFSDSVVFTGGGEPLLNIPFIEQTILFIRNKHFTITTGLGLGLAELQKAFDAIEKVCAVQNSKCSIRISIDRFHSVQRGFEEKFAFLLESMFNNRWQFCSLEFIRTTFIDEEFTNEIVARIASEHSWDCVCESRILQNSKIRIENKTLIVEYKPIIHPERIGLKDIYTLEEYLKIIDHPNTRYFVPKREILLNDDAININKYSGNLMKSIPLTINAKGDVIVYGAEMCFLGNIERQFIDSAFITSKLIDFPAYSYLETNSISKIMSELLSDDLLGNIVKNINYPYEVFRELNENYNSELQDFLTKRLLLQGE